MANWQPKSREEQTATPNLPRGKVPCCLCGERRRAAFGYTPTKERPVFGTRPVIDWERAVYVCFACVREEEWTEAEAVRELRRRSEEPRHG